MSASSNDFASSLAHAVNVEVIKQLTEQSNSNKLRDLSTTYCSTVSEGSKVLDTINSLSNKIAQYIALSRELQARKQNCETTNPTQDQLHQLDEKTDQLMRTGSDVTINITQIVPTMKALNSIKTTLNKLAIDVQELRELNSNDKQLHDTLNTALNQYIAIYQTVSIQKQRESYQEFEQLKKLDTLNLIAPIYQYLQSKNYQKPSLAGNQHILLAQPQQHAPAANNQGPAPSVPPSFR